MIINHKLQAYFQDLFESTVLKRLVFEGWVPEERTPNLARDRRRKPGRVVRAVTGTGGW
jgi:hypothetical protein